VLSGKAKGMTSLLRPSSYLMVTIAGGCAGLWLTPAAWASYPLAIAAGTFLFLGGEALGVRLPGRG
jgi:hypothetical protein